MNNNVEGIITPEKNMTPVMTDLRKFDIKELELGCVRHG